MITVHTIVRNEERFIWYAIASVLEYVDQLLIFDTGSTDATVEIIQSFKSSKITFEQKGVVDAKQLVKLRQEQLDRTKSEWFMILDGDEIYPQKTIKEITGMLSQATTQVWGVVVPFYNFTGDIYHVQKESKGKYQFGNRIGHLNLRLSRNLPGLQVKNQYPNEAYIYQGKPLQTYIDHLVFATTNFFHAGGLVRSSKEKGVMERKPIVDLGRSIYQELPEVFRLQPPASVPDVFKPRPLWYNLLAYGKHWIKP